VLPVAVPTVIGNQHRLVETDAGIKSLVLIKAAKGFHETAEVLEEFAPDEDAASARNGRVPAQEA
jgi:hypothetical protein